MRKGIITLVAIACFNNAFAGGLNEDVLYLKKKIKSLEERVNLLEDALLNTTEVLKNFMREQRVENRLVMQELQKTNDKLFELNKIKEEVTTLKEDIKNKAFLAAKENTKILWEARKRRKDIKIRTVDVFGNTVWEESSQDSKKEESAKVEKIKSKIKIDIDEKEPKWWIIATIVKLNRQPESILKSIRDIERVLGKKVYIYLDNGYLIVTAKGTVADMKKLKKAYPFYTPILRKNKNPDLKEPSLENIFSLIQEAKAIRGISVDDFATTI